MNPRIESVEVEGVSFSFSLKTIETRLGNILLIRGKGSEGVALCIYNILTGTPFHPRDIASLQPNGSTSSGTVTVSMRIPSGKVKEAVTFDYLNRGTTVTILKDGSEMSFPGPEDVPPEFLISSNVSDTLIHYCEDLSQHMFDTDLERYIIDSILGMEFIPRTAQTFESVVDRETGKNGNYPASRQGRINTLINKYRYIEMELKETRDDMLARYEAVMNEKVLTAGRMGDLMREITRLQLSECSADNMPRTLETVEIPLRNPLFFSQSLFDSMSMLQMYLQRLDHPTYSMPGYLKGLVNGSKCICGREMDENSRKHIEKGLSQMSIKHPYRVMIGVRDSINAVEKTAPFEYYMNKKTRENTERPLTIRRKPSKQRVREVMLIPEVVQLGHRINDLSDEAKGLKEEMDPLINPSRDADPNTNLPSCRATIQEMEAMSRASLRGIELLKRAETLDAILSDVYDGMISGIRELAASMVNNILPECPFIVRPERIEPKKGMDESAVVLANALYLRALLNLGDIHSPLVLIDTANRFRLRPCERTEVIT